MPRCIIEHLIFADLRRGGFMFQHRGFVAVFDRARYARRIDHDQQAIALREVARALCAGHDFHEAAIVWSLLPALMPLATMRDFVFLPIWIIFVLYHI